MIPITNADLKVGMIVVMVRAGDDFPGLRNRIFKVIVIDDPYVVLRTTDLAATTHMIVASEAAFSVPSAETITAIAPAEIWPDVIG